MTVKPIAGASRNGARLRITAQASKDLPLHLQIIWAGGVRVFEVRQARILKDTGWYTYGFALCESQVLEGTYTVIVSSFEPGQLGSFQLRFECSQPLEVNPIPQEGAGMFAKILSGKWSGKASATTREPEFHISLKSASNLILRLQMLPPALPTPIRISLWSSGNESGQHALLATSGDFSDSIPGVVVSATVEPGSYVIVPEIASGVVQAGFHVFVYSSACPVRSKDVP